MKFCAKSLIDIFSLNLYRILIRQILIHLHTVDMEIEFIECK